MSSHTPSVADHQACAIGSFNRKLMQRFLVYRIGLSGLFLLLFFSGLGTPFLGNDSPLLFALVAIGYFVLVMFSGLAINLPWPDCEQQAYLMVFIDIIAIILLMHGSGGVTSGLALLLAISIAMGSLVMQGRAAFVFTSIATLSLLTEVLYRDLYVMSNMVAYTQAGLQGAALFTMALLAESLGKRLRQSESVISQQDIDLANLSQLNEYIIQHMQSGVVVIDMNYDLRFINKRANELLGITAKNIGEKLWFISNQLHEELIQWMVNYDDTDIILKATQHNAALQVQFSRLGNQSSGILIFLEDMTALAERAQQIKLASLGQLTASIAHEIRNPLAAISHAGQLLGEAKLASADQRLTQIIHTHSQRINHIIEDILNVSRRRQSIPEPINLNDFLQEIGQEFIQDHQLTHSQLLSVIPNTPYFVSADNLQLRQILTNILSNTVLHFDRDIKTLQTILSLELSPQNHLLHVTITDNGAGIPEQHRANIFEPFYTTQTKGTGLGLYITKELAESNKIRFTYIPTDNGCCFKLTFKSSTEITS